jgi:hypothetical protein
MLSNHWTILELILLLTWSLKCPQFDTPIAPFASLIPPCNELNNDASQ